MTNTKDASVARRGGRELAHAVDLLVGNLRGRLDSDLMAVSYDADGSVLTVEENGLLRRWNPAEATLLSESALGEMESCWAFSRDGDLLVSGSDGVSLWDCKSGALVRQAPDSSWLLVVAFSPDGRFVASGHENHRVKIWDIATGRIVRELVGHQDEVCALAFSQNGQHLASAGEDRLVHVWEIATGNLLQKLTGHTDRVDSLAWSADGARIASAGWDTSARVWDARTGELLGMLNGQGDCVHAVGFLGDGATLVTGDSECTVRIWDAANLKVITEIRRHKSPVRHLAIRDDGGQFATGGNDRAILFWGRDGSALHQDDFPITPVRSVTVAGGNELGVLHNEGLMTFWTLMGVRSDRKPIRGALCSAGCKAGYWAVGGSRGDISVFTNASGDRPVQWRAQDLATRLLAFSDDGKALASSAGSDGAVRIWEPTTGEPVLIIPNAARQCTVESITFHPDGVRLAVAGIEWNRGGNNDGAVVVWNILDRKPAFVVDGGASHLAFSPDGRWLATISLLESILIWDVATGTLVHELASHEATANVLAFDPSSRYLASGNDAGILRVWDCTTWALSQTHELETGVQDLLFLDAHGKLVTGNANSTCYLVKLENLSIAS